MIVCVGWFYLMHWAENILCRGKGNYSNMSSPSFSLILFINCLCSLNSPTFSVGSGSRSIINIISLKLWVEKAKYFPVCLQFSKHPFSQFLLSNSSTSSCARAHTQNRFDMGTILLAFDLPSKQTTCANCNTDQLPGNTFCWDISRQNKRTEIARKINSFMSQRNL